jgi:hypothetical protein
MPPKGAIFVEMMPAAEPTIRGAMRAPLLLQQRHRSALIAA